MIEWYLVLFCLFFFLTTTNAGICTLQYTGSQVVALANMGNDACVFYAQCCHQYIVTQGGPGWTLTWSNETNTVKGVSNDQNVDPLTLECTPCSHNNNDYFKTVLIAVSIAFSIVTLSLGVALFYLLRKQRNQETLPLLRGFRLIPSRDSQIIDSSTNNLNISINSNNNNNSDDDPNLQVRFSAVVTTHSQWEELSKILNSPGENYWRELGDKLGYDESELIGFGKKENRTKALLTNWSPRQEALVSKLLAALRAMDHAEAVKFLMSQIRLARQ